MFNQARVAMMLQFGWKRVASIHQSFELFSSVSHRAVHIIYLTLMFLKGKRAHAPRYKSIPEGDIVRGICPGAS